MSALEDAVRLLEVGDWEAAHIIAQEDESTQGSWAHGIVHMMEGDLDNARYWFSKASRPCPAPGEISAEIDALKDNLCARQ